MNNLQNFEYLKVKYDKDLHDVFGTVLDTYKDISSPSVKGQIYLWEVLQKIKYNLLDDIYVSTFLLHKYINGVKSTAYEERKKALPAICYNARYNGYKDNKHLKTINNLMFLDIDDFKSKEEALAYKSKIINQYQWIVSCNLSLSKIGLHVVIMVDEIIDNDDFNKKYDYISKTYFEGKLDKNGKSLTRFTVVPYDYNIYINYNPTVLVIKNVFQKSIRSGYIGDNSSRSTIIKKSIRSGYIEDFTDSTINEKGIRSGYIGDVNDCKSSITEKSIRSAYIQDVSDGNSSLTEKGIRSGYKEGRVICTAYTFSGVSPVREIMNDSARCDKLRFNEHVDESLFDDPNTPLYYPEGVDVISINLYPYRYKSVNEGQRTIFIGAISAQMIHLNLESDQVDSTISNDILKFILSINKKICNPPLSFKEVLNSFNSNLKKYQAGELEMSNFYQKRKAFWSLHTTLRGNEKRRVTCKIKNQPIVNETQRKIKEAVEALQSNGEKVTQKKVAEVSGLKLPTVKKYAGYYNELLGRSVKANRSVKMEEVIVDSHDSHRSQNTLVAQPNYASSECLEEFEYSDMIDADIDKCIAVADSFKITDEKILVAYERVLGSIARKVDEAKLETLYSKFIEKINELSADDLHTLLLSQDDIDDSTTFFRQGMVDDKLFDSCKGLLERD